MQQEKSSGSFLVASERKEKAMAESGEQRTQDEIPSDRKDGPIQVVIVNGASSGSEKQTAGEWVTKLANNRTDRSILIYGIRAYLVDDSYRDMTNLQLR